MSKSFFSFFLSVLVFILFTLFYGKMLRLREPSLAEKLSEQKKEFVRNPKIVIHTARNLLDFSDGDLLLKRYKINLGHSDFALAKKENKYITTPHGVFAICDAYKSDKYFFVLVLDYPDSATIIKARKNGLISRKTAEEMLAKTKYGCNTKFDKKIFGPQITIHGFGKVDFLLGNLPFAFNWTDGSIALSDGDLEELLPYLKIGTKIRITN